jgi:hypothetical protein
MFLYLLVLQLFSLFISITVVLTAYSFIKFCIFYANDKKSILQYPNKQSEETGSNADLITGRLKSVATEENLEMFSITV